MSAESAAVWCCSKCGAIYHKDFPRCPNDGAEVVVALRDPLLDQSIGNYVIDRLIGEGGMGRVYAAHHATLPAKRYAVKVLLGDVAATSSMRKRFAMEAESASRLDHPNVVHVLDFGEMASRLPYIIMEYVDGVALTALIDDDPMVPARVIRIARAICEALAYAHEAGVIHRDLKPDNVMMVIASDGSEVPKIADFGLATTVEQSSNSRLTTTGMAMGTPAYAAPEQMAGKRVDHTADLYALGMTMFEMLTGGTLPFEGHPLEMMTAKAHKEAARVREVKPDLVLPTALEDLVASLIRRKTAERPGSAREVIAALDQIVLGSALDERAATAVDVSSRLLVTDQRPIIVTEGIRRRRSALPWLAAFVLLATAGGGLWWYRQRPDRIAVAAVDPAIDRVTAPAPPASPAPPPPPIEQAATPTPTQPEEITVDPQPTDPAPQIVDPRHRTRHAKPHVHQAEPVHRVVVESKPPPVDAAVLPTTPPPPPGPVAPALKLKIVTELASVDVQGTLSPAMVRHAIERVIPAIQPCAPTTPQSIQMHFTIDESRRAQHVHGGSGAVASCVAGALGGVRTDTAPDVGDVEVDVKITFAAKP